MQDTLSKQEWVIMEALWEKNPMFLSEINEMLNSILPWKRSTYQTYLKRMTEKGLISYEEIRGSRSYFPLVMRGECVQNESRHIISKMTNDSAMLFLASMIKESGLSADSSEELKKLIESLSDNMRLKEGEGK